MDTMVMPISMSLRGPYLSTSGPMMGPSMKPSACERANAPDVTARDQPNSVTMG